MLSSVIFDERLGLEGRKMTVKVCPYFINHHSTAHHDTCQTSCHHPIVVDTHRQNRSNRYTKTWLQDQESRGFSVFSRESLINNKYDQENYKDGKGW